MRDPVDHSTQTSMAMRTFHRTSQFTAGNVKLRTYILDCRPHKPALSARRAIHAQDDRVKSVGGNGGVFLGRATGSRVYRFGRL